MDAGRAKGMAKVEERRQVKKAITPSMVAKNEMGAKLIRESGRATRGGRCRREEERLGRERVRREKNDTVC